VNREQAFELVRQANPLPSDSTGPENFLSMTALLEEIDARTEGTKRSVQVDRTVERRQDMQTSEKPVRVVRQPRPNRPRGNRAPALIAAIAALAVVVGVWAFMRPSEPDVASRSPIEVTELFNEVVVTGNWSAGADLYTDDATWQLISPEGESPAIRMSDALPPDADAADWDGDGLVTEADFFASLGAEVYAGGITDLLSCSQVDSVTAVCDEARVGYAFMSSSHSAAWTFTMRDGLISNILIDLKGNGVDALAYSQFRLWVKETRPEVADQLFDPAGERILTPDTVELQRELATEWLAEQ
jgi:hypothetical protein